MSPEPIEGWMLEVPLAAKWALAAVAVLLGLPMILWADRIVRGLRKWMLYQLRLLRRPSYRRMLKLYGWLLFVIGGLLMILLLLREA